MLLCRKLYGPDNDAMQIADEIISKHHNNVLQRPSALFLTGDQIYADDVGAPIIQYLTKFGIKLIGYEEQIPSRGKLTGIAPGQRGMMVRNYGKFTSDHADNHLIGFGEFAAMYLVTWNGQNLPNNYDNFPPAGTIPANKYLQQKQYIDKAREALPAIRRILANIPTYMIFDDHEITDDWNLTPQWKTLVRHHPPACHFC